MGNLENWKGLASLAGEISARAFEYEQLQFGQRKNVQRAAEIGRGTRPVALGFLQGDFAPLCEVVQRLRYICEPGE